MLDIDRPASGGVRTSTPAAGWLSPALHASFVLIFALAARHETAPGEHLVNDRVPLAFIDGGGGLPGGGRFADDHEGPAPRARRAEDATAAAPPPGQRSWSATQPVDAAPLETIIPPIPQTSGVIDVPGSSVSIAVSVTTGGGPGQLRGSGSGDGERVGDGGDGYSGSGGRGAGAHLDPPELVQQVRPSYTPGAMQARVRGIVVLEAVVERDGSVGPVKIVRSLDPTFGLDQEAIRTVRRWRFRAGRRDGVAVPVVVTIELAFELR